MVRRRRSRTREPLSPSDDPDNSGLRPALRPLLMAMGTDLDLAEEVVDEPVRWDLRVREKKTMRQKTNVNLSDGQARDVLDLHP